VLGEGGCEHWRRIKGSTKQNKKAYLFWKFIDIFVFAKFMRAFMIYLSGSETCVFKWSPPSLVYQEREQEHYPAHSCVSDRHENQPPSCPRASKRKSPANSAPRDRSAAPASHPPLCLATRIMARGPAARALLFLFLAAFLSHHSAHAQASKSLIAKLEEAEGSQAAGVAVDAVVLSDVVESAGSAELAR